MNDLIKQIDDLLPKLHDVIEKNQNAFVYHEKIAWAMYASQRIIQDCKAALESKGEAVVWMQSDHLSMFVNDACGAESFLARCSNKKLQADYVPLYTAPSLATISVDELSNIIRKVDGEHKLGAGLLAEAILGEITK